MAKTPRTRHSKSKREPVTIDLEADPVSREAEETGTPAPEQEAAGQPEPPPEDAAVPADHEAAASAEQEAAPAADNEGDSADGDGTETPPEEHPAPARPRGGAGRALLGGVVGGIVALAVAGGLQWANLLPAPGDGRAAADIDSVRADLSAVQGELSQMRQAVSTAPATDAVEQALAEPRQEIAQLHDAVSALQEAISNGAAGENAGLEVLDQRLATLESRMEQLAAAPDDDALAERLADLETGIEEARQTAAAAQEQSVAATERLDTLAEQVERQDEGPRLALVVAASALRSAVERGAPFASELETYTAVTPDAPALDALRPYAATGIPTRAALAAEAPEVASRIAAAGAAPPPDAGIVDRLMASARSAVTVRPVGQVEGEAPEAVAARMEAAVQDGDYARALAEYETLPPEAREVAAPFADRLRARQAADQVLEEALSSALQPA